MSISGGNISGGGSDAMEVLALIATNPSEFQRRIEQMRTAQQQLSEVVQLAGPANEIIQMRGDLQRQMIEQNVQDARHAEMREALFTKATQDTQSMRDRAEVEAAQLRQAADAYVKVMMDKAKTAEQKQAAIVKMLADVESGKLQNEARYNELAARADVLTKAEADVEARRRALMDFHQDSHTVLGKL